MATSREKIENALRQHAETTGDHEPLELFGVIVDAGATLAAPPTTDGKHAEAWLVVTSLGN